MIFISYRREDTQAEVTNLSLQLKARYGNEKVFVDFNDIAPGEQWHDTLRQNLEKSRVLLAVIGAKWGNTRFTSGEQMNRLRLDDPNDWVRQEICAAIRRGEAMRVIVITIDDAPLPRTRWGCELDELPNRQQVQLRNQAGFKDDFNKLCGWLEQQIPELKAPDERKPVTEELRSSMLPQQDVRQYLKAELRNHAFIQLPLVAQDGHPVIAPINELRIDLPLIVSHEHAPTAPGAFMKQMSIWYGQEIQAINEELRHSQTDALLVDRASRYEDIPRDVAIRKKLDIGSRLVIVGDPGCGKSTLLQWLAQQYGTTFLADSAVDEYLADTGIPLPGYTWLPVLILCRDMAGQPFPTQFDDLLRMHFRLRQFTEPAIDRLIPHVDELLEQGKVLLLIDGLDEIPDSEKRIEFCKLLTSVANRFPDSPVLITSRVVGFQAVKNQLSTGFDHLLVGPLDRAAKQAFIERWTMFIGWEPAKATALIQQVCYRRITAKLTDNIFLLAMVAQIRILDDKLPNRRVDVYRRATQLMIQRRRPFPGPPLSLNEVLPHVEFLAYWMRTQGLQRCSELDVRNVFTKLRELEPNEPVLQTRSTQELLRACIDSLGLLNEAGVEVDQRGYDRLVIQFFHQSFQEYFAGQALIHEHGLTEQDGAVARLRKLVNSIEVGERNVKIRENYTISEPIIADYWQEAVRLAIADLKPDEANDAVRMLLPDPTTHPYEARPRAVFALQCLADEPPINRQTLLAVFDAILDNLVEEDGIGTKVNTWVDEAMAAVAESSFGAVLHERLIHEYILTQAKQRMWVGQCLTARFADDTSVTINNSEALIAKASVGLTATRQTERVQTALELMNRFFRSNGELGFLPADQQEQLINMLLSALTTDEATESAVIWGLSWLTGARNRDLPPSLADVVRLKPAAVTTIEAVLQRPDVDINVRVWGCLTLTRDETIFPVIHQRDWIYELAKIADGAEPRQKLPPPSPTGRSAPVDWLINWLRIETVDKYAHRIAQTLGAFGVFIPEMVAPLAYLFTNKSYSNADRDEALIYLALIGTPEAATVIAEAADAVPVDNDDYLYGRGLFGLLLMDNVDLLIEQIRKALPDADLDAYAYGLIGSNDPRGRERMEQLREHTDERIRVAITNAFDKAATWQ